MNANLMGSSRFKYALQIGCRFERSQGAVVRHRVLAELPGDVRPDQRHLLATEELRRMGEAGRSYYERNFEPAMLAGRLIQRFEQLVAPCRATPQTD